MKRLDLLTLIILNKLRNEIALREEEHPTDNQERDRDRREEKHEEGKAQGREFAILAGRKSPGGRGTGSIPPGSALASGG